MGLEGSCQVSVRGGTLGGFEALQGAEPTLPMETLISQELW